MLDLPVLVGHGHRVLAEPHGRHVGVFLQEPRMLDHQIQPLELALGFGLARALGHPAHLLGELRGRLVGHFIFGRDLRQQLAGVLVPRPLLVVHVLDVLLHDRHGVVEVEVLHPLDVQALVAPHLGGEGLRQALDGLVHGGARLVVHLDLLRREVEDLPQAALVIAHLLDPRLPLDVGE